MLPLQKESRRRVILVTGASSGIGLELAKQLIVTDKFHIVVTARAESLVRFQENEIVESPYLWIRALDILSKRQRDLVVDEINTKLGGIDIMVNNAAYMLSAVVEHVGEIERLKQMDTNFRAPLSLIRKVLPKMREKRSGKIINISSVGGMMAMPTMAIYSASKFALEGASEALWYEVRPWNIKVTLVQPGFINSDGFERIVMTRESLKARGLPNTNYYYQYEAMGPFIRNLMKMTNSTPKSVARRILRVIEQKNPPLRVAGTWDAHLFGLIRRLLPRSFYHWIFWTMLPSQLRVPAPDLPRVVKKSKSREHLNGKENPVKFGRRENKTNHQREVLNEI